MNCNVTCKVAAVLKDGLILCKDLTTCFISIFYQKCVMVSKWHDIKV